MGKSSNIFCEYLYGFNLQIYSLNLNDETNLNFSLVNQIFYSPKIIYIAKFSHSHKKRKDSLDGSLDEYYLLLNLSSRRYYELL